MSKIERIVKKRGIKFLLHFTRVENIEGILKHGLLPRTQYEQYGISPLVADEERLDYCLEATSLSISFPNYKMFYQCRMDNPDDRWAVLALKPAILWEKDCAFCAENAAKNSVVAIPVEDRKTPDAFERMFAEAEGKPTRSAMQLEDSLPTNPQAEVLVFGRIEPEFVIGVAFDDQTLTEEYTVKFPNVQVKKIVRLFRPRIDYIHWKRS